MDQYGAAFLKVDAFATGLRRHEKTHFSRVESVRGMLPRLTDRLYLARSLLKTIQPFVPIDERGRTKSKSPVKRVHDERLGRLVFRKEQDRLIRAKLLADHLNQAFNLCLAAYRVSAQD